MTDGFWIRLVVSEGYSHNQSITQHNPYGNRSKVQILTNYSTAEKHTVSSKIWVHNS